MFLPLVQWLVSVSREFGVWRERRGETRQKVILVGHKAIVILNINTGVERVNGWLSGHETTTKHQNTQVYDVIAILANLTNIWPLLGRDSRPWTFIFHFSFSFSFLSPKCRLKRHLLDFDFVGLLDDDDA